MKSYVTNLKGTEVSKFLHIPSEFVNMDLEITVKPAKHKKNDFLSMLDNPIKVKKIEIPERAELNER